MTENSEELKQAKEAKQRHLDEELIKHQEKHDKYKKKHAEAVEKIESQKKS